MGLGIRVKSILLLRSLSLTRAARSLVAMRSMYASRLGAVALLSRVRASLISFQSAGEGLTTLPLAKGMMSNSSTQLSSPLAANVASCCSSSFTILTTSSTLWGVSSAASCRNPTACSFQSPPLLPARSRCASK